MFDGEVPFAAVEIIYFIMTHLEHYGSKLPATILTTCVLLLPSGSSYHTTSAAPTITRRYSNCVYIPLPLSDVVVSYTPTIYYTNHFPVNAQHLKERPESFVATQKCIHDDINLNFILPSGCYCGEMGYY